jgi:hypothetical protein
MDALSWTRIKDSGEMVCLVGYRKGDMTALATLAAGAMPFFQQD